MTKDTVIKVENVSKKYCRELKHTMLYGIEDIARNVIGLCSRSESLRDGEFWAIDNISLEVKRGESIGIIGANGSGKSTLLKLLNGIFMPDKGRIEIKGRVGALIEIGAGFHPMLTGRENVYVNGAILGMDKKQIDDKFEKITDFAGIGDFIDAPVKHYSSGMYVRLGFAVAVHCEPDILLVDEVLAVGDMNFQRQCLRYTGEYLKAGGSVILVSHNMHLIQSICDRCFLLDQGQIVFNGVPHGVISRYYKINSVISGISEKRVNTGFIGSNPVTIEKIDICTICGGGIRTGDNVRLTLSYRSIEDIGEVTWGFSIWTGNLQVRIATCTAKYFINGHRLAKGRGELSCTIEKFPLAAGTYAIKAGIYELETSWPITRMGWDDTPFFFDVISSNESDCRHVIDGDFISMDVQWGN